MFKAKDLSLNAQTFLYACAFWTVAADEELSSNEQKWLIDNPITGVSGIIAFHKEFGHYNKNGQHQGN